MFCRKCGTEIKEGTIFCSSCGENINRINEPISVTAKANNDSINDIAVSFINSIINIFKKFFTKGPRNVIDEFSTRKGYEWLVLSFLSIIFCGLGLSLNMTQLLGNDVFSYISYAGLNFGTMLGLNMLTSVVSIFVPITAIWVMLNIVFKINTGYTIVANIYSIAFLPVSIVYVINILVGCVYAPLTFVILFVAMIYGFTLLNYSIQKITSGTRTDIIYLATIFVTVLLTFITWFVSYKETISAIISSIF